MNCILKIRLPADTRRGQAETMVKLAVDAIRNTGAEVTQVSGDSLSLSADLPSPERMAELRKLAGIALSGDSDSGKPSDSRMAELRRIYEIA